MVKTNLEQLNIEVIKDNAIIGYNNVVANPDFQGGTNFWTVSSATQQPETTASGVYLTGSGQFYQNLNTTDVVNGTSYMARIYCNTVSGTWKMLGATVASGVKASGAYSVTLTTGWNSARFDAGATHRINLTSTDEASTDTLVASPIEIRQELDMTTTGQIRNLDVEFSGGTIDGDLIVTGDITASESIYCASITVSGVATIGSGTYSGSLVRTETLSSGTVAIEVQNTSNALDSDAEMVIRTLNNGAGGGDPILRYEAVPSNNLYVGLDSSDSFKYKLSTSQDLSADLLNIDTASGTAIFCSDVTASGNIICASIVASGSITGVTDISASTLTISNDALIASDLVASGTIYCASIVSSGALSATTGAFSDTLSIAASKHIDFPGAVLIGTSPSLTAPATAVIIGKWAGEDVEAGSASTTLIGYQSGRNIEAGDWNTVVGGDAGLGIINSNGNTVVGQNALRQSDNSGCVAIGLSAGRHETGNNKLFIDGIVRGNEADGRTNSIIYGVMDATPASQTLALNANVGVTYLLSRSQATKDAAYTAAAEEYLFCDATGGAFSITLPAVSAGLQYTIKKTDASANAVTIDANASEEIDGELTQVLTTQYDVITIVSDGTDWFTI